MKKIRVIVQAPNVIYDDAGHMMSMWQEYTVDLTPTIEAYISDGLLGVVPDAESTEQSVAAKEEPKKLSQTIKQPLAQKTEPSISQENVNG
jgi:hypothetical protein